MRLHQNARACPEEEPPRAPEPPKPTARIIPFLYADDVAAYLAFLANAFGFEMKLHEVDPGDPEHEHAETSLGGAFVMISHASPKFGSASPCSLPARHSLNYVYVEDVDAHFRHAQVAGATIEGEPADMPWADRMYTVRDPEGHPWLFATPALPNLGDVFARVLTKVSEKDGPLHGQFRTRRKASASALPPGARLPNPKRQALRAKPSSPARSWKKPAPPSSNPCSDACIA